MDYGRCKSCRRQIRWARTAAKGTPMPLDENDERGNVVVDGFGRAHVFSDHAAALAAMEQDPELYGSGSTFLSHHVECPAAEQHRRRAAEPQPAALF